MIEVRNLLFQPLALPLADGKSLHLGPRERRVLKKRDISQEIEGARQRGLVALTELATAQSSPLTEVKEKTRPTAKRSRRK